MFKKVASTYIFIFYELNIFFIHIYNRDISNQGQNPIDLWDLISKLMVNISTLELVVIGSNLNFIYQHFKVF